MVVSSAAERLRGKHAQKRVPATLVSNHVTRLQRVLILVTALLGTAGVAQAATQVHMSVDKEPALCERFHQALEADHVTSMTRDQLCRYSFEEKHGGQDYFEKLDWQPVSGDPVALTLKIFEANVLPPNIQLPANVAKSRARLIAYAKAQNARHALVVEMAPYTRTQLDLSGKFSQVTGYILRSRGTYCGLGHDETYNKRSKLIAFFVDKELTHSMPISGSLIDNKDEPIRIKDKYYVVNLDDGGMWANWYPPGLTGSYSISLSELHNSFDNYQLYTSAVCSYNYFKRSK